MTDLKPLLKSKFVYVWISQILSQLTINIMNFLLLIKLFSDTSSSVATSFLWVSYALPAILIGPFAAALVDILDKRKTLIITNLLQSMVVLIYALTFVEQTFLPYGIAFVYSFLNQFYLPAESATVPEVVKRHLLPRANSLFFITQQASLVLGFSLAGPLNHILGFEISFFLCASLLFLAFLSVIFLPSLKIAKETKLNLESEIVGFFGKIFEGYRFIKENKTILLPFLLLMFIQIIMTMVMVDVPIIAKDLLGIDVNSSGLLMIVPAALGSGIGALVVPHLLKNGWRKRRIIESAILFCVLCFALIIFVVPNQILFIRLFITFILIVILGLAFVGILIPSQTYLQEKTPGGLRGRVFGNFWFLSTVATVIPVILNGTITEIFGVRLMFFLLSVFLLFCLLLFKKYQVNEKYVV